MHELLSPLGRRAFFPPDIPFQAAQARGKTYNATIGQITGRLRPGGAGAGARRGAVGRCRRRRATARCSTRRSRASPRCAAPGAPGSAQRGRRAAVEPAAGDAGLTHGLAVVADLFGGEGRAVSIATPFWGNYRQTFVLRTGARVLSSPAYRDGRFAPRAWTDALADLPPASRPSSSSTSPATRAATARRAPSATS
jgi:hypothetical protein